MNRNTQTHFGNVPKIHQRRSIFDLSHSIKTTFNNGQLIPFEWQEILPGDSIEIDLSMVLRLTTPLFPTMDNLVADVYYFYIPDRLVWPHVREMFGENSGEWAQQVDYNVPQIKPPEGGWAIGSTMHYLGMPSGVDGDGCNVSALPMRAYCKVFNDWFRSEVVDSECYFPLDDSDVTGINTFGAGQTYVNAQYLGATPLKANKTHDYFTSATKSPQKGPSVSVPLGTTANVYTGDIHNGKGPQNTTGIINEILNITGETPIADRFSDAYYYPHGMMTVTSAQPPALVSNANEIINGAGKTERVSASHTINPINLYADLSSATAATINELRTAFSIQKYYEQLSRTGSRYIEIIRALFGVESSDARLQRSEYVGGVRIPINMSQIVQTSSTDSTSPQGHASGFSCTVNRKSLFTKSFEEHGILMGIIVTRIDNHSYQQGIEKKWLRKSWEQFYNPFFAFLGEQAIEEREIDAGSLTPTAVFGYQEAWASYRNIPDRITGELVSAANNGLDAWHYADDYVVTPSLSSDWLKEGTSEVDRTLAVTSELANQFICDLYVKEKAVRCMPVYSVPGLIDHV